MKNGFRLMCLSAFLVSTTAAPAYATTKSTSNTFYENEYATSSGGYIYTPFSLATTAYMDYTDGGDSTISITSMSSFISWKSGKSFPYTGSVTANAVDWVNSSGTTVGSFSLGTNVSYYADPADISASKGWYGTTYQFKTNHATYYYDWNGNSGCFPTYHRETLTLSY